MNSDVYVGMQCDYDVSESNLIISGIMWFCGVDKRLKSEAWCLVKSHLCSEISPKWWPRGHLFWTPPTDPAPRWTLPSGCPSCQESSLLQTLVMILNLPPPAGPRTPPWLIQKLGERREHTAGRGRKVLSGRTSIQMLPVPPSSAPGALQPPRVPLAPGLATSMVLLLLAYYHPLTQP